MKQALIFLTHIFSPRIRGHYLRLRQETEGLLDTYVVYNQNPDKHNDDPLIDFRVTDNDEISERFRQRRHRMSGVAGGFVDGLFVPIILSSLKSYDYIWVMEFDVDYAGNWSDFFKLFPDDDETDFLSPIIRSREAMPDWWNWNWFKVPSNVDNSNYTFSFSVLMRVSFRLANTFNEAVRTDRWRGQGEALWPTITKHNGLSLKDIGEGSNYTRETFCYRPVTHYWYWHEAPEQFTPGLLYHPVKAC